MKDCTPDPFAECIFILAPTGRDAELSCNFLRVAKLEAEPCRNIADLAYRIEKGCGAIVLAEESLGNTSVQVLTDILSKQPSWSEIPVCIITSGGEASSENLRRLTRFAPTGNFTVLERPFRPATLVNALQVAIRSRRRQYQVRDLLAERMALAQRFRLMAESMPQKIFTSTAEGVFDYHNERWIEFVGLSAAEMKGKPWMEFVHPDDRDNTLIQWAHSVSTGELFEAEHRIRRKDSVYRWHLSRACSVKDNGRVVMFIGSNTDVDDQRNAAAKLERLVSERTASLTETNTQLEAFCYTISHDLRAPLRAQRAFAIALLEEFGDVIGENGREYARRIHQAAERLDLLVSDLLAYSRVIRTELTLVPVNLRKVVATVEAGMSFEIETAKAELEVEIVDFQVRAHETTLEMIITNLLSNALKFIKPGTTPRIRISAETRGEWVRLTIADNGIGIDPEYQPQIFRVFNRLHKVGEYPGTGVGLAIVEKAVDRLRGRVGVNSTAGVGSQFWIELERAV